MKNILWNLWLCIIISDFSEAGIYKLSDYTEELAKEHGCSQQDSSDSEGEENGQDSLNNPEDETGEEEDSGFSLKALQKAAMRWES